MSLQNKFKFIKFYYGSNTLFDSWSLVNSMFDSRKYEHHNAVELLKALNDANMIKVYCCTSEYRVDYRTGELHGITRTWYKIV